MSISIEEVQSLLKKCDVAKLEPGTYLVVCDEAEMTGSSARDLAEFFQEHGILAGVFLAKKKDSMKIFKLN